MVEFNIKDLKQIVVPIRFARAISGFSERASPEVDDRGFGMGTRPSGWSGTDVRGAMIGLMVNFDTQIKVVREDIDETAPLYVTCTAPSVIRVIEPTGGGPLPANGIFKVKGLTARGAAGKIEVRLGSATGPVLGELEPHVFGMCRIPIQPHRVQCDTAAATGERSDTPIDEVLRRVRAIWWPCGIHIVYDPASRPIIDDNIQLSVLNQVKWVGDDSWAEVRRVLGLQRTRLGLAPGTNDHAINWYIIPRFNRAEWSGIGISRTKANEIGSDTGVLTAANAVDYSERGIEDAAWVLAHEIGHFLRLPHVQNRNRDNPVRDTYGRRQLMYPIQGLPPAAGAGLQSAPRINDVGYGHRVNGFLITMKNLAHHSTDGECARAIGSFRSGAWF